MIRRNFEKYFGKEYVDKCILKANKITESLADIVTEKVKDDFGMGVILQEANAYDKSWMALKLFKDNKYILSILNTTVKEPHIYIIREKAYVKSQKGNVYVGNKIFKNFKLNGENIIDEFEETYLSDVFTTIIDVINYINLIEPTLKNEYDEIIAAKELK